MRRIGVLTSGGDCPGLNAVIRAVVKTAHEVYQAKVVGMCDGFLGLLPDGTRRTLTVDDVRGIVARGGTILGTTNQGPFDIGRDGDPLPEAKANFERLPSSFDDWRWRRW